MAITAEDLRRERDENLRAIYDNRMPGRVPISISLSTAVVAGYGGLDIRATYWKPSLLRETLLDLCRRVPSDTSLFGRSIYTPVSSQTLRSVNKVMSSTGYMQHPNTVSMEADEYDALIADPYAFILEKCIPRLYKSLCPEATPWRNVLALLQESQLKAAVGKEEMALGQELNARFGYPDSLGSIGFGRAPMDWIADQLRSFSGICIDVRRSRAKLIEAGAATAE